jgi:hypothetical protein
LGGGGSAGVFGGVFISVGVFVIEPDLCSFKVKNSFN